MLAIADHHLRNTDLGRPAERLMQDCVSFFSALLRLEEIRSVEKLRIHLLQVNEVGDVNGMRGLDSDLFKILILHHNIMAAFVFEALYDLVGRNFFRVRFRHFFVSDWAEITGTKLSKTKLFLARSRINGHWNINQTEADAAFPDRSHMELGNVFPIAGYACQSQTTKYRRRNCLATFWNSLILRAAYDPPRQLHELGRARLNCYSADYSGFVRSKETAGTRPRNGPGGEGVSKSKGRIQRRTA